MATTLHRSTALRGALLVALLALAGLAGLVVLRIAGLDAALAEPGLVRLGQAAALADNAVVHYPALNLYIVVGQERAGRSIRALADVDRRSGCIVRWNAQDAMFNDPCLGSIYDRDGRVIGGPSPCDLESLRVEQRAGQLLVTRPDLQARPPTPIPGPGVRQPPFRFRCPAP